MKLTRGSSHPILPEDITRRRFIKRTGAATVGTVLALNALRGSVWADGGGCVCLKIIIPAGQSVTFTVGPATTATNVKAALPAGTATGTRNCGPSWPAGSRQSTPEQGNGGSVGEDFKTPPGSWADGGQGSTTYTLTGPASIDLCGLPN